MGSPLPTLGPHKSLLGPGGQTDRVSFPRCPSPRVVAGVDDFCRISRPGRPQAVLGSGTPTFSVQKHSFLKGKHPHGVLLFFIHSRPWEVFGKGLPLTPPQLVQQPPLHGEREAPLKRRELAVSLGRDAVPHRGRTRSLTEATEALAGALLEAGSRPPPLALDVERPPRPPPASAIPDLWDSAPPTQTPSTVRNLGVGFPTLF